MCIVPVQVPDLTKLPPNVHAELTLQQDTNSVLCLPVFTVISPLDQSDGEPASNERDSLEGNRQCRLLAPDMNWSVLQLAALDCICTASCIIPACMGMSGVYVV